MSCELVRKMGMCVCVWHVHNAQPYLGNDVCDGGAAQAEALFGAVFHSLGEHKRAHLYTVATLMY